MKKTKLRKKIEKDANMLYPIHVHTNDYGKLVDLNEYQRLAFIDGIEYGYLKAIAQAKEWLKKYTLTNHTPNGNICTVFFETKKELLANFETDMNKLWEEKK